MCCGESVQRRTVRESLSQVFLEGRAHPLDPFSATTPGPATLWEKSGTDPQLLHTGLQALQGPYSSPAPAPSDFRFEP